MPENRLLLDIGALPMPTLFGLEHEGEAREAEPDLLGWEDPIAWIEAHRLIDEALREDRLVRIAEWKLMKQLRKLNRCVMEFSKLKDVNRPRLLERLVASIEHRGLSIVPR